MSSRQAENPRPRPLPGVLSDTKDRLGLSHDQAARAAGMPVRTWMRYVAGTSEPVDARGRPTFNARLLSNFTGVPVDELLPPRPAPEQDAAA